MKHPFTKKRGFVIIILADDSFSWRLSGRRRPKGSRVVEEWAWMLGWFPKMREFDEAEREQLAPFLDIDALFAIDWTKLCCPSETGGDDLVYFPYRLCNLTSPDPTIRSNANWLLLDLQQDSIISTLTTKAVPFLLQLISHPTTPARHAILEALWSIVGATRYQIESKPPLSSYACIDPPEPDELILLQEVHQMIAGALSLLIAFLTNDSTDTLASHILSHFPEHAAEIWPTLEQAFLHAENEKIKATFLESLSALAAGEPETSVPWLERVRVTHPSDLVRFVATSRLPHVTKHNTSPALVASLVELLETEPEQLYQQYTAFGGTNNPQYFYYDSISALRVCEPHLRKTALPVLLRLFSREKDLPHNNVLVGTIARALLAFAFPQGSTEHSIFPLDNEQQCIIATLCAYDPIWREWRWDMHLKDGDLPTTREDVFALLLQ